MRRGQSLVTLPHSRRQALAWRAAHFDLNGVRPRSDALSVELKWPPSKKGRKESVGGGKRASWPPGNVRPKKGR